MSPLCVSERGGSWAVCHCFSATCEWERSVVSLTAVFPPPPAFWFRIEVSPPPPAFWFRTEVSPPLAFWFRSEVSPPTPAAFWFRSKVSPPTPAFWFRSEVSPPTSAFWFRSEVSTPPLALWFRLAMLLGSLPCKIDCCFFAWDKIRWDGGRE